MAAFYLTRTGAPGDEIPLPKEEAQHALKVLRLSEGDEIDAAREQWNDGSNTLAVAPGEVVVYARYDVTNRLVEEHGIKIHTIPSAELSRGRGGPRCMSMPLWREDLQ